MPKISRTVDVTSAGGQLTRGAGTVWADGVQVALHPSPIQPHAPWSRRRHPPHARSVTTSGSPTVWAEGAQVVRVTSGTSCGHPIDTGGPTVMVP